jgi:hypothetical protein
MTCWFDVEEISLKGDWMTPIGADIRGGTRIWQGRQGPRAMFSRVPDYPTRDAGTKTYSFPALGEG